MVRFATLEDVSAIIEMGAEFVSQAWTEFEYDELSTKSWLYDFLHMPGTVLLIAEHNEEVIGMLAGMIVPMYFNQDHRNAQEMFWWVKEEHRKSRAGIQLLKVFEKWAIAHGARTIQMGTVARINQSRLAEFYKKQGFEESETYYTKVL